MSNSALLRTSKLFQLTSLSIALTLVGCGGGNDIGSRDTVDSIAPRPDIGVVGGGTTDSGTGNGGTQETNNVNEIFLSSNLSGIKLEKGATVDVTALVLDDKNGVIANQPVNFSLTNPALTGVFSTGSSQIVTDANGKATVSLEVTSPLTKEQMNYLKNTGLVVEATVGDVKQNIKLYGSEDNVDIQKQDIYDVFISASKNELLTGSSSTTVDIRVTDKNGGIIAGVPVILSIKDAAKYGLSFDGSSKQITDATGLVQIELRQSSINVDSQLNHQSVLTVTVDDGKNSVVEQEMPIYVTGTYVNNVKTTKSVVSSGDNFTISGNLLDASSNAIINADVELLNNNKVVGTGKTDPKGKFTFDLNSGLLQDVDGSFSFSLDVKGPTISQTISDIIQVVSISSSNMSFSQLDDIVVNTLQAVELNVPNANEGDIVYISTNKGKIYDNAQGTDGSSRKAFKVSNKKVAFFTQSSAPGLAKLRAEYKQEIKEREVSFVSINPTKLLLQIENTVLSLGGTTSVIARVLDNNDAPVKDAVVQFTTTKDASGGSLDQGLAYTDDSGWARVNYTAGQNPTGSNGVVIEAQVKSIRLPNGNERVVNTLNDVSKLTVQTKSSFISFAFSDKLVNGNRNIYYYLKGSVNVLNSSGKPAVNQPISINLIPYDYEKGRFIRDRLKVTDDNGDSTTTWSWRLVWDQRSILCPSEDTNNNTILDKGEDVNGNGQLDPINVATILTENGQIVDSNQDFKFVTDDTGKVNFQIRYPKEYANWYRAKITVNTRVDGSESQQSRIIGFPVLSDDVSLTENVRPNMISPFGIILSCSIPN